MTFELLSRLPFEPITAVLAIPGIAAFVLAPVAGG